MRTKKVGVELSNQELKQEALNVLSAVDAFCRDNNIKYYLMFGTLIGTVRHQGYIPWDDDIDIGMFRSDYERFIKTFSMPSNEMRVLHAGNNKGHVYNFAKVISTRTVCLEKGNDQELGVFIDVFPIDPVPDDTRTRNRLLKKIYFYTDIKTLKHLWIRKERSFLKNLVVAAGNILKIIPDRWLVRKIDKLHKFSSDEKTQFVSTMTCSYKEREIWLRSDFDKVVELNFEGNLYYAPIGYDNILTTTYGDYMVLPPVEKRVTHHDFKAYWKQ